VLGHGKNKFFYVGTDEKTSFNQNPKTIKATEKKLPK
jgi:hypothetical protein